MSARQSADPREAPSAGAGAGEGAGTGVARTRARARSRVTSHAQEEGPRQANSHLDVEEEDIGKTLSVKDGKLGFVMAKGFIEKTNFIVAIKSQVCSIKYAIKGWLLYYTNFHISI